jgi:hypothetical protein
MSDHDVRVRVNVSITVAVFLLGRARPACRGPAAAAPFVTLLVTALTEGR